MDVLFQMRYESPLNSKKHPNDNQRAGTPPVFTPTSIVLPTAFHTVVHLGSAYTPLHFGLPFCNPLE